MNPEQIKFFFLEEPLLNWLVGSPATSGRISFTYPVLICGIVFVLARLLVYRKVPLNLRSLLNALKSALDKISSPVQWAIDFSAGLIQGQIEEFYRQGTWQLTRRHLLEWIGAAMVGGLIYGAAIIGSILVDGFSIERLATLIAATTWEVRIQIVLDFFRTYAFLNAAVMVIIVLAVRDKAKIKFLEPQYYVKNRIGLIDSVTVSSMGPNQMLSAPDLDEVQRSRSLMQVAVASTKAATIRVLAVSGYDSFGPDGFLVELMKDRYRHWRILILNPDCESARNRALDYLSSRAADTPAEIDTAEKYLDGIRETILAIQSIQVENQNVELRLYEETPHWRLMITSGLVFSQGCAPGQRSDRWPMMILAETPSSPYHSFFQLFEHIWHQKSALPISRSGQAAGVSQQSQP